MGSGEVPHTHEFTAVTNTPEAHDNTLVAAKAMAHTAIDMLIRKRLRDEIKKNFKTK